MTDNKNYPFDPVKMGMMFEKVNDIHEDIREIKKDVKKQNSRVSATELALKDKVDADTYYFDQKEMNKKWMKLTIIVIALAGGAGLGLPQIVKLFTG